MEIQPVLRISQIGSRGIPEHHGGVERVIEAVAPRLASDGHEVKVYCADWSSYKDPTYKGVKLVYAPSIRTKYLDTFVRSLLATVREIFGSSDIIHYHGSGSAPLALLARLSGKKVVVTVHGLDWQRRKWNAIGQWFLRAGEWAATRFPHRTVVVGLELKRYLDEHYHANVTYIPNGVEDRIARAPDKIKRFGIGHRDYVLYLGRLVPEKQCHVLIEAFQKLANKGGMRLVIAGPTWHSQDYVATLRKKAGACPSIIFTDEVDEETLEELYSNCYAYVLPSEVEGMSLSLLDAMAFGACILASEIPANAEVLGGSGILFKTGNMEDLRSKLQQVIHDLAGADRRRRLTRKRMTEKFHWDGIARQWELLYIDLVS